MNLKTDIKIILDSHVDEPRFNQIRQMHKTRMSGYDVVSNFSMSRGLVILIRKTSGYTATNINLIDTHIFTILHSQSKKNTPIFF